MLEGTTRAVTSHDLALLGSVVLTGISQAMIRIGARSGRQAIRSFLSPWTLTAYVMFGLVVLLMIYALRTIPFRTGMAVSALVYVTTPLAARIMAKDPLTSRMMLGALVIATGIVIFFW